MTDAIGHTMEDIVVAKVHVALIQHWLLVLLTAVELGSYSVAMKLKFGIVISQEAAVHVARVQPMAVVMFIG